eukprot:790819-Pyramimonas_sp.AAC.1
MPLRRWAHLRLRIVLRRRWAHLRPRRLRLMRSLAQLRRWAHPHPRCRIATLRYLADHVTPLTHHITSLTAPNISTVRFVHVS